MKNINAKIFCENGFEKYKGVKEDNEPYDLEFWIPSGNKPKLEAFFIVIYVEYSKLLEAENIKDACLKYYNLIEHTEVLKSAMEKNTYSIICMKIDSMPINQVIKKKIFDIEEDPQKFKKHVIIYTENQIKSFNDIIKNSVSTKDTINDVINSDEFQVFKSSPDSDSLYNFVAKLFIKLPFLKYQSHNKEIMDLSTAIVDKIETLGDDKLVLVNKVIKMEINAIKQITTENLLNLLKGVEIND